LQGTGGKLTKAGTGTLTLSGANTYTGTTNISTGTLKMSGAGTIATSSSVLIGSGAIFDLNGTNQTIKLGTSAGTIANNSGCGTSSLTFNGSADLGSPLIVDSTANPGGKVAVVVTANSQTFNVANT
jgi:fibronectin-binding autotransporter adhesin